jgi:small GTP-binding protein
VEIDNVVIAGSVRRTGDGVYVESLSGVPFHHDLMLGWRPGTEWLAGRMDGRLVFWEARSKARIETRIDAPVISALTWSPDGQLLSVYRFEAESSIYRVPAQLGNSPLEEIARFSGGAGSAWPGAWSPASDRFAYISSRQTVSITDLSGSSAQVDMGSASLIHGATSWSPSGKTLAVPSLSAIDIVEPELGRITTELKAHTSAVMAVAFSPDERLLASVGRDRTIRLWATADWQLVATIKLADDVTVTNWVALQFHPSLPLLCSVGTEGGASLYELDIDGLLAAPATPVKRYATAKVVLVGESGVGKTGLGYRLATGEYQEHSSTHGQQFWVVDSLGLTRADGVRCEVVLWDLAGQPDYRLIHVLFLDDADAALVVIDASRRHELLDVATFWIKALAAARPGGCVKLLVAARSDRGNAAASAEELEEFAARFGVEAGFVETSALTGDGLPELARVLREHVRWDDLPMVMETPALAAARAEVLRLKEQQASETPLVPVADLQVRLGVQADQAEIGASVRDLQVHGFVHVMRAADGTRLVLLEPELLNNLASSLILEARRNDRGLGALDEAAIFAGRYRFPELDGLHDEQRRVLAESAIVLFLEHNVCFRESLGDQVLLIFPELINERPPTLADATRFVDDVTYVVTGSIENVYASLVVLLGYTNVLRRKDQWRNQAQYELDRHLLHFRQERSQDDRLEIVLSYPDGVPDWAKRVFQGLVERFLQRRQVAVRMYPRVACPECGHVLPRVQVIQFIDEGTGITYCPRGGHAIPLLREPEQVVLSEQEQRVMAAEAAAAAERTAFTVVATQLRGYLTEIAGHRQPLVVFVSYPWGDPATESWVRDRLVPDLEQAGIEIVLDRTSSRVGGSLTRFVERADTADRVLVIATPEYAHKYGNTAGTVLAAEADVIGRRLLGTEQQKSTVLPVLLAGTPAESLPPLMQTRICADFRDPDRYFIQLFELVLALHDLAPDISALKDLRAAMVRAQREPVRIPPSSAP